MAFPRYREISDALTGSFMLARRDTGGYGYFNATAEGFWRSFAAIILIAPFFFAYAALERDMVASVTPGMPGTEPDSGFFTARAIALVLDWFGFPLVMVLVARIMDFTARYGLFIIVYNWSSVLAIAFLSPPFLLHGLGLISANTAAGGSLALTLFVVYYRWFIARTALEVPAATAAAVVALDLLLSMVINAGVERAMLTSG